MALCTPTITGRNATISTAVPAKRRTSNSAILSPSRTILRTSCAILRPPPSVASKAASFSLRATTPQKYVYPDPIPEFAAAETLKFRAELPRKLSREKDTFGNDLDAVIDVCSEIFSDFLNKEYGGPGTLLVEPFTDMMIALKEKNLPGAPLAARTSLLWAQNYLDQDWEIWNSKPPK
ncbi:hypothetical protein RJ639_007730 [Escallonia herrerae]|uniref:Protein PLASTID REDOX INSENSITIVE 2, chloroplastic-like n=1 Tax=Escallonia herrerae TaxID=1293975 RepID=A0AA89AUC6_9ASTE|nr:hypothetical protein RJ639_007730 [Escallonia herrerae]